MAYSRNQHNIVNQLDSSKNFKGSELRVRDDKDPNTVKDPARDSAWGINSSDMGGVSCSFHAPQSILGCVSVNIRGVASCRYNWGQTTDCYTGLERHVLPRNFF